MVTACTNSDAPCVTEFAGDKGACCFKATMTAENSSPSIATAAILSGAGIVGLPITKGTTTRFCIGKSRIDVVNQIEALFPA